MPASIDQLLPERGLIQLSSNTPVDFDVEDYRLNRLHGDVLLCEYIDLGDENGDTIKRGNVIVPINAQTRAWRKARVVIAGVDAKWTEVGDIVLFPHNYGVEIEKIEVTDGYVVPKGVFLNEARIFGSCEPREDDGES